MSLVRFLLDLLILKLGGIPRSQALLIQSALRDRVAVLKLIGGANVSTNHG